MDQGMHVRLASLRRRFVHRIEKDIPCLDAHLATLPNSDPAVLEDLKKFAHKLAGSAGSFGFVEVGQIALALEHDIQGLQLGEVLLEQVGRTALSLKLKLKAVVAPDPR